MLQLQVQLVPSMTMMATVYYVDWHPAAATTETTATLTARCTPLIDLIRSTTVYSWYLWTWGDEEEKVETVENQSFRALLSCERGVHHQPLQLQGVSQVHSPICRIRICVCVKGLCVVCACVYRNISACFSTYAFRGQRLTLGVFIYLLIPKAHHFDQPG